MFDALGHSYLQLCNAHMQVVYGHLDDPNDAGTVKRGVSYLRLRPGDFAVYAHLCARQCLSHADVSRCFA